MRALIQRRPDDMALAFDERGQLAIGRRLHDRVLAPAYRDGLRHGRPAVVLIDEIDKATRDLPNDLLHALDKIEFVVTEAGQKVAAERRLRPILFITSNSERRLPEPFLRRCV